MNVSQLSGSLALLDMVARQTAGVVQVRPGRVHKDPKSAKVNGAEEKEKSSSSTEKGQEPSGTTGKTRTA
ncbi:MAG TPA: hypothetical protein DCR97_07430 [Deltaproteobacteria bacterium]|nr:hypothetical protein [Deltaproteobacteria bacterium]